MEKERTKEVHGLIQTIEKTYGKGSVMRLGGGGTFIREVSAISSGSIGLDIALGIGGLPRGRVVEIYGPEASGKTTLALHAIAEVQKKGGLAAFIDAEHALDIKYASALGVNVEDILISQPDYGEMALDIVESMIRSGLVDIIVVDSVAALTPKAEIDGEMGDAHVGLQARLMSQALRKLTALTSRAGTIVIFINQIRMKIGNLFGNSETTTGGNALKFYSSVRIEIRRIASIKDGENTIGNKIRVKVVKNKVAPPFKESEIEIIYGRGICRESEVLDLGTDLGIIEKNGTWYSYRNEKLGQGRDSAKNYLFENREKLETIAKEILSKKLIYPGRPLYTEDGKAEVKKVVNARL